MLAENPGVDVGIHLAITSEWDNEKWRPLSDCPSLKDPDGYLFVDDPGLNDDELQAISHIGYEHVAVDRQGVTDAWTSPKVKAAIEKKVIQLVSYKDLLGSKH